MCPEFVARHEGVPGHDEDLRVQPGVCCCAVDTIFSRLHWIHLVQPGPHFTTTFARAAKAQRLLVIADDSKVIASEDPCFFP